MVTRGLSPVQQSLAGLWPQVVVYEGEEQTSKTPLTFAYAGSPSPTRAYWLRACLGARFTERALGRHPCWSVTTVVARRAPACDFILAQHTPLTLRHWGRRPGFRIPFWVPMAVDISRPVEQLFGSQKTVMQRRIRKNRFTYAMTRDPVELEDFYSRMYVPYIRARHTDSAVIGSRDEIAKDFAHGELLLVTQDGKALAGTIVELDDRRPRMRSVGVRDADWELVRSGVLVVLYHFLILEMKRRGYTELHLGLTRPLLSDGVMKFKTSIDGYLLPDKEHRLWLRPIKGSTGFRSFLVANPFLFVGPGGGLRRAVFADARVDTVERIDDRLTSATCHGVTGTDLFVLGERRELGAHPVSAHDVRIRSGEELFG